MALADQWHADRAPGLGKRLIVSGNTVGVSGVVAVGQPTSGGGSSTIPAGFSALPEPGSVIPPAGNPDRAAYLIVFKNAVGFDGKTSVYGWSGAGVSAKQTGMALSCWVNFGITNVPAFVPNPLQGDIFTNVTGGGTALATLYPGSGLGGSATASAPTFNTTPDGSAQGAGIFASSFNVPSATFTYPSNGTTSAGWVHLMMSWKFHPSVFSGPAYGFVETGQIVVNDDVMANETFTTTNQQIGYIDFTGAADAANQAIGGDNSSSPPTAGWYGAVTEYVVYPKFIDWSLSANRYKFHVTDGNGAFAVWAPCDIGATGRRPGFGTPLLYCTGGPSSFPYNRATGSTLSVSTGTSGLITIDSPPS